MALGRDGPAVSLEGATGVQDGLDGDREASVFGHATGSEQRLLFLGSGDERLGAGAVLLALQPIELPK